MRQTRAGLWLVLFATVSCDGARAENSESQVEVILHTGDVDFEGLLTLPEGEGPFPVVMFMTGSGPSPHRFYYSTTENFYDPIAELFNAAGLGYFSFDKRGSSDSQAEPYYVIDEPVYLTSTLTNMTADGEVALDWLRQQPGVDAERVIVWGQSMGTQTAPVLADRHPEDVRGMILTGWVPQNLSQILADNYRYAMWYEASLYADADRDATITEAEWNALDTEIRDYLWASFYPWAELDADADGDFTEADNAAIGQASVDEITEVIDRADESAFRDWFGDDWIYWVSTGWCRDAFDWQNLPALHRRLRTPTRIVQGDMDLVAPTGRLADRFAEIDRGELPAMSYELIPGGDHYLGWWELASTGEPTEHMTAVVRAASELAVER